MRRCIDPKFQDMLHAFELDMLSESDRSALEAHLLECDSCFEEARSMLIESAILRQDHEIKDTIKKIASKSKSPSGLFVKNIINVLWPDKPRFILAKPLALLVILLIISYPVYRLGFPGLSHKAQTLNLFPMRGVEKNTIVLEKGGDVVINFIYEKVIPGNRYNIVLVSREGDVIYSDSSFSQFNDHGLGSIALSRDKFKKGSYMLRIIDPSSNDPESKAFYYFKAE